MSTFVPPTKPVSWPRRYSLAERRDRATEIFTSPSMWIDA